MKTPVRRVSYCKWWALERGEHTHGFHHEEPPKVPNHLRAQVVSRRSTESLVDTRVADSAEVVTSLFLAPLLQRGDEMVGGDDILETARSGEILLIARWNVESTHEESVADCGCNWAIGVVVVRSKVRER